MFAWNMIEQLVITFPCIDSSLWNISWPVRPAASDQYSEISPVSVVTEATCGWKHSQMWWSNSSCLYLTLCCFLSVSLHQVDVSLRVVQRPGPRARQRARARARQEVRQKYELSLNNLEVQKWNWRRFRFSSFSFMLMLCNKFVMSGWENIYSQQASVSVCVDTEYTSFLLQRHTLGLFLDYSQHKHL